MPNNIITSIFGGGGGSSAAKGMRRSLGRGGNELIEEWPTRENNSSRRRTTWPTKPPPPVSDVHVSSYSVPTRQSSDYRPRRMTPKQHRYDGMKHAPDEESSCGTTADMVSRESFSSIADVSMDFSAFSLNDMPSVSCATSVQSTGSRGSRHSAKTAPGIYLAQDNRRRIHPDTPMRGRRPRSAVSTSTIKKRVSFSDEAPSVHRYVPIAPNTHYNDDDDDYFREHTITLARGVLRILQTDAIHDDTFDTLTGLPSADIVKAYLNHPDLPAEEIVGIEDLLAGSGVASARKRLKKVQTRNLLSEQKRQSDMGIKDQKLLARSLRKTSAISANIARCRAAYSLSL